MTNHCMCIDGLCRGRVCLMCTRECSCSHADNIVTVSGAPLDSSPNGCSCIMADVICGSAPCSRQSNPPTFRQCGRAGERKRESSWTDVTANSASSDPTIITLLAYLHEAIFGGIGQKQRPCTERGQRCEGAKVNSYEGGV